MSETKKNYLYFGKIDGFGILFVSLIAFTWTS